MVADQPEDAVLGEDCGFVVERAVAKVKGETGGNPIAVSDLNEITCRESGAFECFENKESVKGSLRSTDRNGVGERECRYQKACREEEKET
jgi:hypothetical protein